MRDFALQQGIPLGIEASIFADLPAQPLVHRAVHSPVSGQPPILSIQAAQGEEIALTHLMPEN